MEEQKIDPVSPNGHAGQENKDIDLTDKRFNIQLKKGDQMFIFSVPDGTPYGSAYDACLEILIALKDMINKSVDSFMVQPQEVVVDAIEEQN